MKDWNGNGNGIWKTLGASNHTDKERQSEDFYATDPISIHKLCAVEKFTPMVWECACGAGHMAEALKENGYKVMVSDIVDRGYPHTMILNFFDRKIGCTCDIITNPPYKYAKEFVEHALDIVNDGRKVAMFLKLTFLEGKARRKMFEKYPPKKLYVFSERVMCAKNGDFEGMKAGGGSAVAYAWFIWEKGYNGKTTVRWI